MCLSAKRFGSIFHLISYRRSADFWDWQARTLSVLRASERLLKRRSAEIIQWYSVWISEQKTQKHQNYRIKMQIWLFLTTKPLGGRLTDESSVINLKNQTKAAETIWMWWLVMGLEIQDTNLLGSSTVILHFRNSNLPTWAGERKSASPIQPKPSAQKIARHSEREREPEFRRQNSKPKLFELQTAKSTTVQSECRSQLLNSSVLN